MSSASGPAIPAEDPVLRWARHLLALTASGLEPQPIEPVDRRAAWARSGAMALTGDETGPPVAPAVDVGAAADGAALALRAIATGCGRRLVLDGAGLLGERAATAGLSRRGAVSVGGTTRLLATSDGWIALGLRRDEDHELVPALVQNDPGPDSWEEVRSWAAGLPAADAADRARLLGLPAARLGELAGNEPSWRATATGSLRGGLAARAGRGLRVVDLSALWAGPLAASLLGMLGAEVVRVESPTRPDRGRTANPRFFDLLNRGKQELQADLRDPQVRRLVASADVVVTSGRRRAMEQLDLVPQPDQTWVTVTGYGWDGPGQDWPGYGDDAAVAAGLVAWSGQRPVFCADAVADPIAGLHAAVAAAGSAYTGRALHLDVSLAGVAAAVAATLPWTYGDVADLTPSPPHARSGDDV